MKTKDIATKYGLNRFEFEAFIKESNYSFRTGIMGMTLSDNVDVEEAVNSYNDFKAKLQEEQELLEQEEAIKRRAMTNMLITSGFSFEGYKIVKYSGYISGDDAVQVERGQHSAFLHRPTDVGESLMASLVVIRRNALEELKEAAYALGCNAVIGVDFDYITLDPQTATTKGGTIYLPYVFGVTANGNAVVIEKIVD